jgi:hypothetical protein
VRGWGGVGRGKLRRTSLVKIEVRKDRCELGGEVQLSSYQRSSANFVVRKKGKGWKPKAILSICNFLPPFSWKIEGSELHFRSSL